MTTAYFRCLLVAVSACTYSSSNAAIVTYEQTGTMTYLAGTDGFGVVDGADLDGASLTVTFSTDSTMPPTGYFSGIFEVGTYFPLLSASIEFKNRPTQPDESIDILADSFLYSANDFDDD